MIVDQKLMRNCHVIVFDSITKARNNIFHFLMLNQVHQYVNPLFGIDVYGLEDGYRYEEEVYGLTNLYSAIV
jgi:hypothetical protein